MGNLYIVATPIGNLQDITLRAMDTLSFVDFLLCEDVRTTSNLLNFINKRLENEGKKPRLIPLYEGNEVKVISEVILALKNDSNIAIVSDAGTPTISDPGFKLVRECIKEGIKVMSIPGPTSLISALVSSGLPTDKFLFMGFLPKKQGHKKTTLENIKKSLKLINSTVIIFESPHRIIATLEEIKEEFGDIEIVVARELTKIHEEIRKDLISNQISHYKKGIKGEIVLLFNLK
nr:16S rRNA (cytidine(1402)-2'-O)-methyltransferase [Candidatus Levybacteria bacterium]